MTTTTVMDRMAKHTWPRVDYESHVRMPLRVHTRRRPFSSRTLLVLRMKILELSDDYVSSLFAAVAIWP